MPNANYNVVIITQFHTIMATIDLIDQRLSDLLNDQRHSAVRLRDVRITRLGSPTKLLEQHSAAILHKDQIVLAFETLPPPKTTKRLYGYVKKMAYKVYMILDEVEVQGYIHTTGGLELNDIHRFITGQREHFLPVTQATVTFCSDERFAIRQDAIIVNMQRMHYIAKIEPEQKESRKPEQKEPQKVDSNQNT